MIKLVIGAFLSVMFAQSGFAATDRDITLLGVGCGQNGGCYANVSKSVTQSCSNNNQVRWDGNTSAGKSFTAAALTAKASGAKVTIGTVDGSCNGNFPVLNFITVN